MKILIYGSHTSQNYGSAAMVISAIKGLNEAGLEAIYFKGSATRNLDIRRYSQIFSKKKLIIFGFNQKSLPIILVKPLLLLYSIPYLLRADLVLETPGRIPDDIGFFSQFARFLLPWIFGKKFVIYASSLGPFKHRLTRYLVRYCYSRVSLLLVREKVTRNYLLKIGVKNQILTADGAFLMKGMLSSELEKIAKSLNPFVGISLKAAYDRKFTGYRCLITEIIKYISQEMKINVLIIPHTDDEKKLSREIFNEVKNKKVFLLKGEYLPQEVKAIIAKSQFHMGSRIHSCIAALSSGVPAIPLIPHSNHRGVGIMRFFGMEDFVMDVSSDPKKVISFFVKHYPKRSRLKKRILRHLPVIEKMASKNAILIKELLEKNAQGL